MGNICCGTEPKRRRPNSDTRNGREFQVNQQQPQRSEQHLSAAEERLEVLQRDLQIAQREVQGTQKKLQALNQTLHSAKQKIQVLEEELKVSKHETGHFRNAYIRLEESFSELKSDYQSKEQTCRLQSELVENLKQRLSDQNTEQERLNLQINNLQLELLGVKQQLERSNYDNDYLKQQCMQLPAMKHNLNETFKKREEHLNKTINAMRDNLDYYIKQRQQDLDKISTLTKNISELRAVCENSYQGMEKEKNQQIQLLQENLSKKEVELLDLQKRSSHLEQSNRKETYTSTFDIKNESKGSEEQLSVKNQIEELLQELRAKDLEIQDYRIQINQLQNYLAEYKTKADQLQRGNKNSKAPEERSQSEINLHEQFQTDSHMTQGNKVKELSLEDFSSLNNSVYHECRDLSNESLIPEDPYVTESLDKIAKVSVDLEKLKKEVLEFSGTAEDRTFLHLKELLIRNIIKLDNVESEGHVIIRERRKEAIQYVHKLLDNLAEKVTSS